MGIGFTNMSEFEVVSVSDSALTDVPHAKMRLYELTRNLDDLPPSIWMCSDQPVVFRIKPLTVSWESVAMGAGMDAIAIRTIVREHITSILLGRKVKHPDFSWDRGKLDDESLSKIPLSVVSELAGIIVQAQDRVPGGSIPFSPSSQPTYQQGKEHTRLRNRLALVVSALDEDSASQAEE